MISSSITNIEHKRGDHFALTCNLSRDNTNWSGSVVTVQLRTGTQQLVTDASGGGYVSNSTSANTLSVAVSIPNTVTSEWPDTLYGDVEVYCAGANIQPVTPVQFKVTVYDDFSR